MTWEEQFARWSTAEGENPYDDRVSRFVIIETRKAARNGGALDAPDGWRWVSDALNDKDRRVFVHAVFQKQAAPKHLAPTFLVLAVAERDPSANRLFVEPAVKAMGARRVMERLTTLLREGSEFDKGGAVSAAYWVQGDANQLSYHKCRQQFRDEMLRQFVTTPSTFVRQRIIPQLSMNAEDYSEPVATLIAEAIDIARRDPDPYVRHRVEVQLGAGRPLRALPN